MLVLEAGGPWTGCPPRRRPWCAGRRNPSWRFTPGKSPPCFGSLPRGAKPLLLTRLAKTFRKLEEVAIDEPSFLILEYLRRWDVWNIKTLLRGKFYGASDTDIMKYLVPAGELSPEFLEELYPGFKESIDWQIDLVCWKLEGVAKSISQAGTQKVPVRSEHVKGLFFAGDTAKGYGVAMDCAIASGVTMTLSGAASATTTTATDGTYTFSGLANGTYTVTMQANQVTDTAGNPVAPGTLGTFTVAVPNATRAGSTSARGPAAARPATPGRMFL